MTNPKAQLSLRMTALLHKSIEKHGQQFPDAAKNRPGLLHFLVDELSKHMLRSQEANPVVPIEK
ncbi:hypothetical protein GO730_39200 [Spirosoma sp. HMF3257]|uniref:Uncharacterized protein n=1 Tax=Spirosoma telluris TaxID=2183553 RepID=A0A327NCF4_9BACT|nr:hypothetical protein [Spirosoma telluris]RAI72920.1 hypothetical protein HMF3257_39135 [Spirosoma telluris]